MQTKRQTAISDTRGYGRTLLTRCTGTVRAGGAPAPALPCRRGTRGAPAKLANTHTSNVATSSGCTYCCSAPRYRFIGPKKGYEVRRYSHYIVFSPKAQDAHREFREGSSTRPILNTVLGLISCTPIHPPIEDRSRFGILSPGRAVYFSLCSISVALRAWPDRAS